jgi:hypothetical protein
MELDQPERLGGVVDDQLSGDADRVSLARRMLNSWRVRQGLNRQSSDSKLCQTRFSLFAQVPDRSRNRFVTSVIHQTLGLRGARLQQLLALGQTDRGLRIQLEILISSPGRFALHELLKSPQRYCFPNTVGVAPIDTG